MPRPTRAPLALLVLALAPPAALSTACAKDEGDAEESPQTGERNCGEGIGQCPATQRCLGGHCVPKDLGDESVADEPDDGEGEGEPDAPVVCRPACAGAQTCGAGGQCEEPARCEEAVDCRPGRVCAAHHRCVDVCLPGVCPRVELCISPSSCEPPVQCGVDGDCTPGTRCRFGLCHPDCDTDNDCPSRQTCGPGGGCAAPEQCGSHRDCPPSLDCIDAACVPPVVGACEPDVVEGPTACPFGRSCGPTGACGRRRGCEADPDCGSGVCSPFAVCAECRGDGDCPGAQFCTVGEFGVGDCAEALACISDDDCLRGRVCGPTGFCGRPDNCVEDSMSPNHTGETAVFTEDTMRTGLRLCPGADDWFEVFIPTGYASEIYLFDIDDAGLWIELYDSPAADLAAFISNAPGPGERLAIGGAQGVQRWYLRVTAPEGGRGRYDLDIRLRRKGVCLDDPFEDWGGDDSPETATPLPGPAGTLTGRRFCGDPDWYLVTLLERSHLSAFVSPPDGLLALSLLDPDGTPIPLDESSPSEISVGGLPAGRYRMMVTMSAGSDRAYNLSWNVRPDEEHLLNRCRAAQSLTSGQRWTGQLQVGAPDNFRGACAPGEEAAPEAVARIDLDELGDISVRVTSADFEPVLYLRRGCAGGTEDVSCAHSPGELYGGDLPPGAWYVFLDAAGPLGDGAFEAQVLTGDVTPPGANEACDRPARIEVDDQGGFRIRGDTGGAQPDLQSPACAPFGDTGAAADLVYQLTTEQDAWLIAEVLPQDWDAVLHVYTDGCDEGGLIACGDEPARVSIPRLPAGQHYLVVDGYRDGDAGAFELVGALAEPPPSPANDGCEAAQLVELDPATRRAVVLGDTTAATDQGEVGCGQAASRLAPDQFYRVALAAPSDLRVQVVPGAGYSPAVALRSGGCRDGVELVCTTAAPHALSAAGLLEGDYLIVVDGAQPSSRGAYELIIEATPR